MQFVSLYIMDRIKDHTKTYRSILVVLFVLFSLTPCPVRKTVLGVFDIPFAASLNKARTTTASGHCNINTLLPAGIVIAKAQQPSADPVFPEHITAPFFITGRNKRLYNHYSGCISGNSPPKYILFKRLKLHLA